MSDAADPQEAARSAGLRYVSDERPGILRRRAGAGFTYRSPEGRPIRDPATLERIRSLVIPPAWTEVWICPSPEGHIQATGRDARGRKQYRYHPRWRSLRDTTKYEHLIEFARALPGIRARIEADMAQPGLGRQKVLATVAHLLNSTLIRIGNDEYARSNNSHGLTTLLNEHVAVQGMELRFTFTGKSGREWQLSLRDRRIARVVRACQELPGQELFEYLDDEGVRRDVGSSDVNDYLREIAGPEISAKDFRTWAGTVLASAALREAGPATSATAAKRQLSAAMKQVAARLGNTPAITRSCYVHPAVIEAQQEGTLQAEMDAASRSLRQVPAGLRREEAETLAFLEARASRPAQAPRTSPAPRRQAQAGSKRHASIAAPPPRAARAAPRGSARARP